MSLQDSPNLDDYQDGVPSKPPEKSQSPSFTKVIIGFLFAIIIIMGLTTLRDSTFFRLFTGVSSVSGQVVDHTGKQFAAEVVLTGTNMSIIADSNGKFILENVPEGTYDIVFLNDYYGWEEFISLTKGQSLDMGVIVIPYFEVEP